MEVTQRYMGSELMAELTSWNQQEQTFKKLFSDQALQDREFLKMKLAEFDHIWYKHHLLAETTDEKALIKILQYQRNSMQKSLYPGLLTRFVVRTYNFLAESIKQSIARPQPDLYNPPSIVIPNDQSGNSIEKEKAESIRREQFNPRTYRQTKNQSRDKRKGRSI